jgi:hypothetical protein
VLARSFGLLKVYFTALAAWAAFARYTIFSGRKSKSRRTAEGRSSISTRPVRSLEPTKSVRPFEAKVPDNALTNVLGELDALLSMSRRHIALSQRVSVPANRFAREIDAIRQAASVAAQRILLRRLAASDVAVPKYIRADVILQDVGFARTIDAARAIEKLVGASFQYYLDHPADRNRSNAILRQLRRRVWIRGG